MLSVRAGMVLPRVAARAAARGAHDEQPRNPPPDQPPYGAPAPGPASPGRKGFFGALFDFRFEHFITPIIVKVVYVLALVALVLGWLVLLAAAFSESAAGGVAVLVLGPIAVILYLASIRMTLPKKSGLTVCSPAAMLGR